MIKTGIKEKLKRTKYLENISTFSWFLIGLFILILISSLLGSKAFIYYSLTPFYLYVILSSLLIAVTGGILLKTSKHQALILPIPVLIFLAFGGYSVLHGILFSGGLNFMNYYVLINSLLFLSVYILLSYSRQVLIILYNAVVILACIVSCICIGQYVGCFDSVNSYFKVTGTWENPNVSAMFLAMAVPAVLSVFFGEQGWRRKVGRIILSLLVCSLLILKCRTALIGAGIAFLIFLNFRYNLLVYLKSRNNRAGRVLLLILITAFLVPLGIYSYYAKKASADGRVLVWKTSLAMISEKPLTGYGYGFFERNYNLFQAGYVKNGAISKQEQQNAGHVNMAYNEFLEQAVVGGVVGFLLFTGILVSLLIIPVYEERYSNQSLKRSQFDKDIALISAYAGIGAFAVMSIFNFSVQAIPAMALLVLYGAALAGHTSYQQKFFERFVKTRTFQSYVIGTAMLISGAYLCVIEATEAIAQLKNKAAANLVAKGNYENAELLLRDLTTYLKDSECYWRNYGDVLYAQQNYVYSVTMFNKAKAFTANPAVYSRAALCYMKLKEFKMAEENYLMAKFMEPSRFVHRYLLMKLYLETRNPKAALSMAREIIDLKPKTPSKEVFRYKQMAKRVVQQLTGLRLQNKKLFDKQQLYK